MNKYLVIINNQTFQEKIDGVFHLFLGNISDDLLYVFFIW